MFTYTILGALAIVVVFAIFQLQAYAETRKYAKLYKNFFNKKKAYKVEHFDTGSENILQLSNVGLKDTQLSQLIDEINRYIFKTKGTTDFGLIQNKVERRLTMLYDQANAKLNFPTHMGLMGTFLGVGLGIFMFLCGFDSVNGISDIAIKNLLTGVVISMITSLLGLILSTLNHALIGKAQTQIAEDKNDFYDFIQTELMPSLDVSLNSAVRHLHETIGNFEPAFSRVINHFQTTFNNCTTAFGNDFEKNVTAVAGAVQTMGKNMDKINYNIDLQQRLLDKLEGDKIRDGLEAFVNATERFRTLTKDLNGFEKARQLMVKAIEEVLNLQGQYNQALEVPRRVAVEINSILNRITIFEKSINTLGTSLANAQMLGNEQVTAINQLLDALRKNQKIADKYLSISDESLKNLYKRQIETIEDMGENYKRKLSEQNEAFNHMLTAKFDLEGVSNKFTTLDNLNKLTAIERLQGEILLQLGKNVSSELLLKTLSEMNKTLVDIRDTNKKISEKTTNSFTLFGGNSNRK